MGSRSDSNFGQEISQHCQVLGIPCQLRVSSAHKSTEDVLKIIAEYDGKLIHELLIASTKLLINH